LASTFPTISEIGHLFVKKMESDLRLRRRPISETLEKRKNHCAKEDREVKSPKIAKRNGCPISKKIEKNKCLISENGGKNDVRSH